MPMAICLQAGKILENNHLWITCRLPVLPTFSSPRCSAGVTGKPVFRNCNGNQCTTRQCQYDGQLYEAGCVFVPDLNQNSKNSIMYMQSLPSVSIINSFWGENLAIVVNK